VFAIIMGNKLVDAGSLSLLLTLFLFLLGSPVSFGIITFNGKATVTSDAWNTSLDFPPRFAFEQMGHHFVNEYAAGEPFPHLYIDGLFPPFLVEMASNEFPRHALTLGDSVSEGWNYGGTGGDQSRKLHLHDEQYMGYAQLSLIGHMRSSRFISFLEIITGIPNLIFDSHLWGAGLHQIVTGGSLGIHADFNRHSQTGLWRRVNVFLYLNDDWLEEWGGHLELWRQDMSAIGQRILPVANRMVIFSSSRRSFHGHPDPLACPEYTTRKSIALYYYSSKHGSTDVADDEFKTTLFRPRPHEEVCDDTTQVYYSS